MVLAHLNLLRKIVGIIGNVIALCLFLSPTPTFVEIVKKKSVEKYSPIPYLATLINCLVRGFYGFPVVHPDSTLIVTLSGVGVVIEIVFLTIFFIYCDRKKQRLVISFVLAAEFAFVAILAVLVLTRQHTTDQRTVSVGIACCVFNTILYVSPMPVMKMVIKTKSVEFMPFWLSVACFLNGGVWTLYGFLPFDPFMAIPNGIGCVCGLSQLILYATYYKSTKRIMAERQKLPAQVGEMGLSNAIVDAESEQIANFNLQGFGI